jgi:4-amino-4-deoxy-L-arabinose transferase-like glycosyltransferase
VSAAPTKVLAVDPEAPDRRLMFRYRISVGVLLLIALALRIPGLGESLWFDELWSTHIKLGSLPRFFITALRDVHPPGYHAVGFVWIRLFGDSELSIRVIPMLSGVGGVFLVCELARQWGTFRAGIIAGLLVALSPVHIWYSQEARSYAFLSLTILLAVWARSRLSRDNADTRWFALYVVSMGTALSLHYYALAFAASYLVVDLLGTNPFRRRLVSANLIGCLAVLGYVGAKLSVGSLRLSYSYLKELDAVSLWMTLFDWFPTGHTLFAAGTYNPEWEMLADPLMFGSHLLVASLLVSGCISVWRRRRADPSAVSPLEPIAPLVCVPAMLFGLSFLGFAGTFIERSLFVCLPFFFILVALGLDAVRPVAVRAVLAVCLLVLMVSGLAAFHSKADEWTVYKPNPDWRSAAALLLQDTEVDRAAVFVASPADVLRYYSGEFNKTGAANSPLVREPVKHFDLYGFDQSDGWAGDQAAPPYTHAFMIRNDFWRGKFEKKREEFLAEYPLELVDRTQLKGLLVEKYLVVSLPDDPSGPNVAR